MHIDIYSVYYIQEREDALQQAAAKSQQSISLLRAELVAEKQKKMPKAAPDAPAEARDGLARPNGGLVESLDALYRRLQVINARETIHGHAKR